MQSKGWIRFVAILLAIASIWQLSFTVVTRMQESKAAKYAEQQAVQFVESNNVPADVREYVQDSVANIRNRAYIDSISAEKVFLGYTFKSVKEKEINLGLDLKGGMNVMLQVQLEDLVKALSGNSTDPDFVAALAQAKQNNVNSSQDFIGLFADAWAQIAPQRRMAEVFATYELRDKVSNDATNAEVVNVIRSEAKSAVDNSFNVLRNRIDRFGVTQPNIQQVGNSGKILIELPGVKDPERVRKLLQGTASLEFWNTYNSSEIMPFLQEVNRDEAAKLAALAETEPAAEEEVAAEEAAAPEAAETLAAEDSLLSSLAPEAEQDQNEQLEAYRKANPLFGRLQQTGGNNACLGLVHYRDTAEVMRMLRETSVEFPNDFVPALTFKPSSYAQNDQYFELVALKSAAGKGAVLDGGVITSARVNYSQISGAAEVGMTMNTTGSARWEVITEQNIGKQIAIVMDGLVYSYPNVQNKISGGSSQITGNFTPEEAEDLATVLKSGKLSTPARIVQEQVVGPSLGSASIKSGMISFALAFLLVLIYMFIFYRRAGLAADLALLCNVLFLFGALVSFGAVLTLPGIAGLVLTMGMAVDANVIIYERVKEELRAGKSLRLAIADGYKNAYSAIIDGQLTTLITGIILYFFGSGPVKGFAAVLVIGIVTSVFTSIFIPRLIFERRLAKNKDISFDSPATRNFLKNTHIDFIKLRKTTYIISGVLCAIALISIFTKGFSYGVDFSGGRTYVVRFDQPVNAVEVRASMNKQFDEAPEVKTYGPSTQLKITTKYKIKEDGDEVKNEIMTKLYEGSKTYFARPITLDEFKSTETNPLGIIQAEQVGGTIAHDNMVHSIWAIIGGLIIIFVYIGLRFRSWRFGLGSVAALTHDTILVIGMFSLLYGLLPFNLDVDQYFISAVLTVIGYSINATVVIFDRVREYRKLYPKRDLMTHMNDAINSTLARTINTSGTTFVTLLMMFIFGGEVIRGFIFALLVGVVCGMFSSVCIACPVVYEISKRKEARKAVVKQ